MKALPSYLFAVVVFLLALAAAEPTITALSSALLPLVVVVTVGAVVIRLVFFHTRRW